MYSLEDFIPYDGKVNDGEHVVLIWSRKEGYRFIQFGYVFGDDIIIVAKEDV